MRGPTGFGTRRTQLPLWRPAKVNLEASLKRASPAPRPLPHSLISPVFSVRPMPALVFPPRTPWVWPRRSTRSTRCSPTREPIPRPFQRITSVWCNRPWRPCRTTAPPRRPPRPSSSRNGFAPTSAFSTTARSQTTLPLFPRVSCQSRSQSQSKSSSNSSAVASWPSFFRRPSTSTPPASRKSTAMPSRQKEKSWCLLVGSRSMARRSARTMTDWWPLRLGTPPRPRPSISRPCKPSHPPVTPRPPCSRPWKGLESLWMTTIFARPWQERASEHLPPGLPSSKAFCQRST